MEPNTWSVDPSGWVGGNQGNDKDPSDRQCWFSFEFSNFVPDRTENRMLAASRELECWNREEAQSKQGIQRLQHKLWDGRRKKVRKRSKRKGGEFEEMEETRNSSRCMALGACRGFTFVISPTAQY